MNNYKNKTNAKIWYCDACMAWKEIEAFDWRITRVWCIDCQNRILNKGQINK